MDRSAMRRSLALYLLACATLAAQIPPPISTPDKPFFIKKTWIIGGTGNWDYLTLDPKASRLFIAHGSEVQVVDVETGDLAGTVKGLREAHSVALDETGELGYVSDAPAGDVKVFDRRTFEVAASIHTCHTPRAIAIEPDSGLLVAICPFVTPPAEQPLSSSPRHPGTRPAQRPPPPKPPTTPVQPKSVISILDTESRADLADILVAGRVSFAQAGGRGRVFIAVEDRNLVAVLDLSDFGAKLRNPPGGTNVAKGGAASAVDPVAADSPGRSTLSLDWSDPSHPPPDGSHIRYFAAGSGCNGPRALAVDAKDERLFIACNNLKMAVLNSATGESLASVPIGPDPDAVGYDDARGLIFTANGGAQGSMTVIRRDGSDSYKVVQTLATRQQARTLAVNSSTGQVYLVTIVQVAQLGSPPKNGIGTLKVSPQDSSFQVLVVGN